LNGNLQQTIEGEDAWYAAMKALGQQNSLPAFLWSEHLALAA